MQITNKNQMYSMMKSGQFGNTFRTWTSEEEFMDAVRRGFRGLVGVRCVGVGLPYVHHKGAAEAIKIGRELEKEFNVPVMYCEASQDEYIILQGEFTELRNGPVLEWTTARTHMRKAFEQEHNVLFGPGARLLLKQSLTESSYQDFLALGEIYPEAVIEFTAYEILVGNIPGRNHVCWECRNY